MTNVLGNVSVGFRKGFSDQETELMIPSLEVEGGAIPTWLSGTLVRNGPASFRLADKTLNHWFDGLAMLHRFDIADGRVSYANKFLDTPARRAAQDGELRYSEFATDPCRSLFKRITQMFISPQFGANNNISVGKIADEFVALTEVPMPVAFDKETLDTIGVLTYEDHHKGDVTTAHPHHDRDQQVAYNYLLKFGAKSTYDIYKLPDGTRARQLVGRSVARKPSYMHSFALSAKYAILMEFPLVVNPLRLLLRGKPFIENYRWEPERGTRFSIVDRRTGVVSYAHTDEAWFGFHHVNAVDRDHEDDVIDLDILVYPTAEVVQHFYLTSLLDRPNHNVYPDSELRRFTINTATGMVTSRTLADRTAELPRINYNRYNTKPYRYAYANGIAERGVSVFLDTIVKFDVESGDVKEWRHDNHFPGEPVFVARPDPSTEDDGILLTVVLDASTETSYLLLLDARDLSEIARAQVPQHVPFGFHGIYVQTKPADH
jgi:beta,beta-carotene 9',10'-dioxygenase